MSAIVLTATAGAGIITLGWTGGYGSESIQYNILRKQTGEGYSALATRNYPTNSYDDTTVGYNTTYTYYIVDWKSGSEYIYSAEVSATLGWADTISETCTCTETVEAGLSYADIIAETCTVTDAVEADRIRMVDYGYYLGCIYSAGVGAVLLYSDTYGEDDAIDIVSDYKTKKLDCSDQFPQYANQWKTAYRVRLYYVDRGITLVTIYLSTDGGVTWETQSKSTGTAGATGNGDGVIKTADFYFIKTGMFFNIKIERTSLDTDGTNEATSQWISLELDFEPRSDYFEVS